MQQSFAIPLADGLSRHAEKTATWSKVNKNIKAAGIFRCFALQHRVNLDP
jgi:hypothetical protein